ncbi:hypothetical protein GCM10027344_14460 [Spelaeicoccus albus]
MNTGQEPRHSDIERALDIVGARRQNVRHVAAPEGCPENGGDASHTRTDLRDGPPDSGGVGRIRLIGRGLQAVILQTTDAVRKPLAVSADKR